MASTVNSSVVTRPCRISEVVKYWPTIVQLKRQTEIWWHVRTPLTSEHEYWPLGNLENSVWINIATNSVTTPAPIH